MRRTVPRMSRINGPGRRATILVAIAVAAPLLLLVGVTSAIRGGSSNTPQTGSALLDAGYAKSIGFPRTLEAAKKTRVTTQKGCTDSVESVYEDAGATMGLLTEVVNCNSERSATAALAVARKQMTVDKTVRVPQELGRSAFATANLAPEYLIAWQSGTRLVFTAIDTDVKASSSTTGRSPTSWTPSQRRTLMRAAVQQNALLK